MGKMLAGMATVQLYVAPVNSPPQYIVSQAPSFAAGAKGEVLGQKVAAGSTSRLTASCHHHPRRGPTAIDFGQRLMQ